MRLLTRKIYRAFRELDQFDDDVCERYVDRASAVNNAWKLWLMLVLVIPAAYMAWIPCMLGVNWLFDSYKLSIPEWMRTIVQGVAVTGAVWMPLIAIFITRDNWLRRSIRKQLIFAVCRNCGYTLLGLPVQNEKTNQRSYVPSAVIIIY